MPTVTKTALLAGRACDLRAYRGLVKGDRWSAPPAPPTGLLVEYRARHLAANRVHRLWQRGGVLDAAVLPEVWADAWRRAGGDEPVPPPEWLAWYAADNPFHLGAGRQIVACEETLRTVALGRAWSARPDLLCVDHAGDGAIEALELSSARVPTLDKDAVERMAAIDLLVLARTPAYVTLPHRVLVCGLETGRLHDVTPALDHARDILRGIDAYLQDIEARGRAWDNRGDDDPGPALATPSPEACGRCAYRGDCAYAWPATVGSRDAFDTLDDAVLEGWPLDGAHPTGLVRSGDGDLSGEPRSLSGRYRSDSDPDGDKREAER